MFFVVALHLKITRTELALIGTYFEGFGHTLEEAETAARRACDQHPAHITVIPKIRELQEGTNLIDLMYDSADQFEKLWKSMEEADQINTASLRRNANFNKRQRLWKNQKARQRRADRASR